MLLTHPSLAKKRRTRLGYVLLRSITLRFTMAEYNPRHQLASVLYKSGPASASPLSFPPTRPVPFKMLLQPLVYALVHMLVLLRAFVENQLGSLLPTRWRAATDLATVFDSTHCINSLNTAQTTDLITIEPTPTVLTFEPVDDALDNPDFAVATRNTIDTDLPTRTTHGPSAAAYPVVLRTCGTLARIAAWVQRLRMLQDGATIVTIVTLAFGIQFLVRIHWPLLVPVPAHEVRAPRLIVCGIR